MIQLINITRPNWLFWKKRILNLLITDNSCSNKKFKLRLESEFLSAGQFYAPANRGRLEPKFYTIKARVLSKHLNNARENEAVFVASNFNRPLLSSGCPAWWGLAGDPHQVVSRWAQFLLEWLLMHLLLSFKSILNINYKRPNNHLDYYNNDNNSSNNSAWTANNHSVCRS